MKLIRMDEESFYNLIESSIKAAIGKSLITEGITDKTYHFCSINSVYNILKDGMIRLSMSANSSDAYDKKRLFYLSTQRSKSNKIGFGRNKDCRIEINGYQLKADGYTGRPLDYWGASMGKQTEIGPNAPRLFGYKPTTLQDKQAVLKSQGTSSNFEFEDRIFSNKPYIPMKYISRIDCMTLDEKYIGLEKEILKIAAESNVNVYFYDNHKDFILQTDNTVNDAISATNAEYNKKTIMPRDDEYLFKFNAELITQLLATIFYFNNDEEIDRELYNILKKFNLEPFYDYAKENINKTIKFIDREFASIANKVRKLNTDEFKKTDYSNNIMLLAQYTLNKYNTNSFLKLKEYFDKHM